MIHQFDDYLSSEAWQNLRDQCDHQVIQFDQLYPRRILSHPNESAWLLYHFQPTIDRFSRGRPLQQIFLSMELPGSRMAMHRSHPNIDQVLIYPVDDIDHAMCLRNLVNTQHIIDDYWDPDLHPEVSVIDESYPIKGNRLLIVDNSSARLHWGSDRSVPPGHVHRFVWIYIG